jgi:hypothetical protein
MVVRDVQVRSLVSSWVTVCAVHGQGRYTSQACTAARTQLHQGVPCSHPPAARRADGKKLVTHDNSKLLLPPGSSRAGFS